ncbi:hypothetical protein TM7_0044 [candidate division TM7 genomosp. GTL1]|nr:hypothetical protein TM7_0044 [candidate division TM7 genomosp. GTL1]
MCICTPSRRSRLSGSPSVLVLASFVADILLRPSVDPDSQGKTFSDSPGWVGITQGGIIDRESMMRFVTAGGIMLFFNRIKKLMELGGISPTACKHVNAWYGQAGILIGGLITSFLTLGLGAVAGVVSGAALGLLQSVAMSYATPMLAQMAAGTVAPDPEKDKEGGYGAGNALAAGAAAVNMGAAQSNGMRPLTYEAG